MANKFFAQTGVQRRVVEPRDDVSPHDRRFDAVPIDDLEKAIAMDTYVASRVRMKRTFSPASRPNPCVLRKQVARRLHFTPARV